MSVQQTLSQVSIVADNMFHLQQREESPHQYATIADPTSLRYDPELRLKVRQTFSNLEHLQNAGVILSHAHICSMIKTTLGLHLTRDAGAQFVRHFVTRPGGSARLSSTHDEDRRARYDAFAEDVWHAMSKTFPASRVESAELPYHAQLDIHTEALPGTGPKIMSGYADVLSSRSVLQASCFPLLIL